MIQEQARSNDAMAEVTNDLNKSISGLLKTVNEQGNQLREARQKIRDSGGALSGLHRHIDERDQRIQDLEAKNAELKKQPIRGVLWKASQSL
jgi:SMC interacting uncharacterized protein involved in chromosome segregation